MGKLQVLVEVDATVSSDQVQTKNLWYSFTVALGDRTVMVCK